jgi:transposase
LGCDKNALPLTVSEDVFETRGGFASLTFGLAWRF